MKIRQPSILPHNFPDPLGHRDQIHIVLASYRLNDVLPGCELRSGRFPIFGPNILSLHRLLSKSHLGRGPGIITVHFDFKEKSYFYLNGGQDLV